MKPVARLAILAAALCSSSATAWAAGGVIAIGVANNRLTVSGGTTGNSGFADRAFAETGTDGYPTATNVSGFGPSFLWTVPGVRLDGLADNSGLYIEALARPVRDASPAKDRVFWYWDPTNGAIEDVPEDNHFLIYRTFASQSIFLAGSDEVAPPRLKLATPLASDLGFDSYGGFLRYALHRAVPPAAGVYGFFARLTSDVYQPSDPFLVVFNQGPLTATQVTSGALAINTAADDAANLPGDFNHNGTVDAADYTVWRNGLGGAFDQADYTEWKNSFGDSAGAGSVASVPEPAGLAFFVATGWFVLATGGIFFRGLRREIDSR
ncbi:MAG: hypothetical protein AB7G28_14720 [Pirellulales bacterium]